MKALDLRGLVPAPVTPFTTDGAVDYAAIQRIGAWLGSVPGVKGLTVLGHAGEGTFLERDEQAKVIEAFAGHKDGWGMAYWFRSDNSFLGGKRPQDLLATAPERVIDAALDEVQEVAHG